MTLRKVPLLLLTLLIAWGECVAASKPHVITFGKWIAAKWPNATGEKMLDLKVRALLVDARLKEYTTGNPHELTDRLFAVRRAFRINDALPAETVTRWQWQRGGWLLVDRLTGHVSQLKLPEFDPFFQLGVCSAITMPTAEFLTMARNSMRSWRRWDGASRF